VKIRSLGIEEEFLLFRRDAPQLFDVGPRVVASAERAAAGDAQFEKELKAAQAELATQPATDLAALAAELAERRGELARAATERGARLVAAGTSPADDRTATTENDRYQEMERTFGAVQHRQLTCAMHVHVGIDSEEEGVRVVNGVAPWLPALVALSGNSPFHRGRDTGYASYRRIEWGRWPTAGPTGTFADVDDYRRSIRALIETGAARDDGMIYFDARLSANYPTVEIRVCDVATDPSVAVALAALCRALVATAADGGSTPPRFEVLRAAHWRAARFGTSDQLVDLAGVPRLVPAWEHVDALLDRLAPALDTAGDTARVEAALARIRQHGTGAERQRVAVAEAGGDVAAAIDATTLRA
jgi:glutamate---cysteine ligase / carboxylate-amine ligase